MNATSGSGPGGLVRIAPVYGLTKTCCVDERTTLHARSGESPKRHHHHFAAARCGAGALHERVERQRRAGRHHVWLSRAAHGSFEHKQAAAHRDDREKDRDDEREPAMSDQEGAMHVVNQTAFSGRLLQREKLTPGVATSCRSARCRLPSSIGLRGTLVIPPDAKGAFSTHGVTLLSKPVLQPGVSRL